MKPLSQKSSRWLLAHTLAIAFSLSHVILDWHLNLFGPLFPTFLTAVQGIVLVFGATLYATWAASLALAAQGSRRGIVATLFLCTVGGLGNGLSIVACLPPCSGAFPFGDISHLGSLLFGSWAIVESGRMLRQGSQLGEVI